MDGAFHLQTLQEATGHQASLAEHWLYNDPEASGGTLVAFKSANFHSPEYWHASIVNPYSPDSKQTLEICIGRAQYTRLPPQPTETFLTIASIHFNNVVAQKPGAAIPVLQTTATICDNHQVAFIGCDLNMAAYHPDLHNIFPWILPACPSNTPPETPMWCTSSLDYNI